MHERNRSIGRARILAASVVLAFSACLLNPPAAVHAIGTNPLVVVVNKANPAAGLTKAEVKKMMLGERQRWPSGAAVVVVLKPAGSSDREAVLSVICGMSEADFTRQQMQASFTGGHPANVKVVETYSDVKAQVAANPGAIGFLHQSDVDAQVKAVFSIN